MSALAASDRRRLSTVARRLAAWLPYSGRHFPWRNPGASTYEKICVEVLVQRTKAETVAQTYNAFFAQFPSWRSLAAAEIQELEGALKPLGLWRRRAVALKALGGYAAASGGVFPKNRTDLEHIPAVGQYVASAILLFQHNRPEPLIDTNTSRVLERYFRPRRMADIRYDPWLQAAARLLVSAGNARAINWAILDLGAKVCTPRRPKCTNCPIRVGCSSREILRHAACQDS